MGAVIAKMLLPMISSLVFLPAASVATKRGFHMEAMVYFFTMFFTSVRDLRVLRVLFYHVCTDIYLFELFVTNQINHFTENNYDLCHFDYEFRN